MLLSTLQVGARCCRLFTSRLESLQVATASRSTMSTGLSVCTVEKIQHRHQVVQQMVSQPPLRANHSRNPF